MKLSEAPRCVPFDDFKERNTRVRACITTLLGISGDDFLHLWFDLGVDYAEMLAQHRDSKVTAAQLIRNNLYWNYWIERWITICDYWIQWRNPGKNMETFREFHLDGMPPLRIFNLLQITSQSVETRLIASLQSTQSSQP
jgi:hypothetical protein